MAEVFTPAIVRITQPDGQGKRVAVSLREDGRNEQLFL
jgi:hypothetical protein